MAIKKLIFSLFSIWFFPILTFSQGNQSFIYNGFRGSNLHIDGSTNIHPNGLLQLTNTSKQLTAHAFYTNPINFNSSLSFSTTFAFAMYPELKAISGHGILFVISPSTNFSHGVPGKYFGLFDSSTNGLSSNHVFAVELDTIQDVEFKDIDSNHVGIDINNLQSNASVSAGYFSDIEGKNKSLDLISAKPMRIWIDYDGKEMLVNVTMAPLDVSRPSRVLLSTHVNLSDVFSDSMYVGFSSSTGSVASSHYLLGWSFSKEGKAQDLDLSKLPPLPKLPKGKRKLSVGSMILIIIISVVLVAMMLAFYLVRRKKFDEVLEDWEQEYLLQRFAYKDLYKATKGFKDKELLGSGGFGKVYKGVLPSTKAEVAVKRVIHGSQQGMREFVAEIAVMGRLRHRNLVQLLGYCRTKGDLLLVYDYMPNGSLDKYLYSGSFQPNLSWRERFRVIRGVASALLYLHEEWEQVIVHRDVKASNVLLDAEMNARLGDFGLARLYDHGTNPQTTHVVGTVGYLAPELTRRGKATTSTDVFSFGVFLLEVASGRSPIDVQTSGEEKYLVEWMHDLWRKGILIEAIDPKLERDHDPEEVELALKVGMVCCHPRPEGRPSMRQVMQFLDGDRTFSGIIPNDAEITKFSSVKGNSASSPLLSGETSSYDPFSSDSILTGGR